MSVNFAKNQDEITNAWRKVVDEKGIPNWALYSYEGNTNVIRLMSTGSNGLASLVQELNCSLIQYAFCRVIEAENNVNKLVLINWQGDSAPLSRKGLCASHVGDVANYFKGATQTITIRNDDEATVDYLMSQIIKSRPNRLIDTKQAATQLEKTLTNQNNSSEHPTSRQIELGPNVGAQIAKDRKTFWQLQEEEEKLRLIEEKKRAAEKEAEFLKERLHREQLEAERLAETVKERDRFIEATRTAERRESASSMSLSSNQSSYASYNTNTSNNNNNHAKQDLSNMKSTKDNDNVNDDDDERVGRRSELIRLERNQETQSLISKGQIKNRRALFERASQQQESKTSQTGSNTLSRRPSGAMIKKRLDAFQSLEQQPAIVTRQVEKIIVDRTNNLNLNDASIVDQKQDKGKEEIQQKSNQVIITSAIESVKLTRNDAQEEEQQKQQHSPVKPETASKTVDDQQQHQQPEERQKNESEPIVSSPNIKNESTNGIDNDAIVVKSNGTSKQNQEAHVIDQNVNAEDDDDDDDDGEYQRELEQTKQAESCLLQKNMNGISSANKNANGTGNGYKNSQHEIDRSPSPLLSHSFAASPIKSELDHEETKSNGTGGDLNENNNHITATKSTDELQAFKKIAEALMANEDEKERAKPKAVAIYDYQAADKTEISFDPNDLIGFIEKVDVGWWHGVVLSGKYAGQRGLFPHNHVMEF